MPSSRSWSSKRALLILSFSVLVLLTLTLVALGSRIRQLTTLGYLGLFLIALFSSMTFVFPGPSLAAVLAAGARQDPWLVGLLMGVGSAIGELPGFATGALTRRAIPRSRMKARLRLWVRRSPSLTIFLLAAVPNFLYDIGALLAGTARMPLPKFFMATLLGKIVRFTGSAILAHKTFAAVHH